MIAVDVIAPQQRRFSAWGTSVHLHTLEHTAQAELLARRFLDDVDRACSRFRDDSDLTQVNRRPGTWVSVSPLLVEAATVALDAAHVTDGLVDPLLGRSLVELGYDRDFATIVPRREEPLTAARPGAWREIEIDAHDSRIRIPAGTAIDLGATCKAWAADVLATDIADRLSTPVLVSIGGDLRAAAPAGADPAAWEVLVTERPEPRDGDAEPDRVRIDQGGLATSSTQVRRWRRAGAELHHVLDPRTGLPVAGRWRTVTATGPTCVAANVATTAALVLGDRAIAWLDQHSVDARLVSQDGLVQRIGRWPAPSARPAVREGAPC